MTNPQDPFGHNPFTANPFDPSQPPVPPIPPPGRDEPNTLATLSVVFAFVFAPAGALLGHLGLSQIAHSGQRGRDRALVGVTLSYVFITAAVVALVVWAALGHNNTAPQSAASAPATTGSASPATTTTSSTSLTPPPPPPTVAPTDLAGLLPNPQEAGSLTGKGALTLTETATQLGGFPKSSTFDPSECTGTVSIGSPAVYEAAAVAGYRLVEYSSSTFHSGQSVAAYNDAPAAAAALKKMIADWRTCGGKTVVWNGTGSATDVKVDPPADSGNGVTTLVMHPVARGAGGPLVSLSHAIAARSNILVDVVVLSGEDGATSSYAPDNVREAIALANFIVGKIPG